MRQSMGVDFLTTQDRAKEAARASRATHQAKTCHDHSTWSLDHDFAFTGPFAEPNPDLVGHLLGRLPGRRQFAGPCTSPFCL